MAITQSPLKMGLSKVKDLYVQGAEGFGNRLGNIASKISDTAKNIREIRNPELIQRQQGASSNNTGGGVNNNNNAGNIGVQVPTGIEAKSTDFKPIDFSNPTVKSAASSQDQRVFSTAAQDNNLAESKGRVGSYQYAQDSSGNILKRDMSTGSISKLGGNISSIGPNGSTVSRQLRPEEQVAMDRSRQMVAEWRDYKSKLDEERRFNNLIAGRPASSQLSAIAVRNKDLTDRAQIEASKENARIGAELQYQNQQIAARKNAFDEQKGIADTSLKTREQLFKEGSEGEKILQESRKNLDSPLNQVSILRTLGQLTPSRLKSIYADKLSGAKTREDVGAKLGDLLDSGEIDDESAQILISQY